MGWGWRSATPLYGRTRARSGRRANLAREQRSSSRCQSRRMGRRGCCRKRRWDKRLPRWPERRRRHESAATELNRRKIGRRHGCSGTLPVRGHVRMSVRRNLDTFQTHAATDLYALLIPNAAHYGVERATRLTPEIVISLGGILWILWRTAKAGGRWRPTANSTLT